MNKDYYYLMNRKVMSATVIAASMLLVIATNVSAEIKKRPVHIPLPDAYQEYIYNLNVFYNDRKQFDTDKSKYLAYKTVQSKEDALSSSVTMLESSRLAMLRYLDIVEADLQKQDEFNSRVKNAILTDINTHKTYLSDAQTLVNQIATLEEGVTVSSAFNLRYTYVKSTANQALMYHDVLTAKKRNDTAREITSDFKNIVAGYPPDNIDRETVDKWAEATIPELADNERLLNELIETMYPIPKEKDRPVYELQQSIAASNLNTVNSRLRLYTQRFKEIDQIAKEAYRKL